MFISNKYKKWYDAIIIAAQTRGAVDGYNENHHIVPQCLGGTNEQCNLVTLTAKEHFICHMLLPRFTTGDAKKRMWYSAHLMAQVSRDYQDRYKPSARTYEMLKIKFSEVHSDRLTGRRLTDDHRRKISEGGKGRVSSPETIEKRRAACTGQQRTAEQKERMSLAQKGRPAKVRSDEEKAIISQKISAALSGRKVSTEHKAKLSAALLGKKTGPKSDETKQKMRKPKSEEHRKAISEARLKKYAMIRDSKH